MFLLVISIILFIIVLVLLIYPNWPKKCGNSNTNVQQNPCNRCGQPKNHCGCNPKCTLC